MNSARSCSVLSLDGFDPKRVGEGHKKLAYGLRGAYVDGRLEKAEFDTKRKIGGFEK
jgi:hypothetical protein